MRKALSRAALVLSLAAAPVVAGASSASATVFECNTGSYTIRWTTAGGCTWGKVQTKTNFLGTTTSARYVGKMTDNAGDNRCAVLQYSWAKGKPVTVKELCAYGASSSVSTGWHIVALQTNGHSLRIRMCTRPVGGTALRCNTWLNVAGIDLRSPL